MSHAHVPIAVFITAHSRQLLGRYISQALQHGNVAYCDTDSVFTDATFPTSNKLGELKEEKTFSRGVFVAPKLYSVDELVKAKGFSKLQYSKFETMVRQVWEGEPLDTRTEHMITRMLRLKELYGSGLVTPCETEVFKHFALLDRPKRWVQKGGDSIPWDVRQVGEPWKTGLVTGH